MATAKWRKYSEQEIREIVQSSQSHSEVAKKLGYSGGGSLAVLKNMYKELQIDTSHFSSINQIHSGIKVCAQCKKEKDAQLDYYWSNGKTRTICKDCVKVNERQRYAERTEKLNLFKQTLVCKKCGETRYYLFEFHHRDPQEKDFQISDHSRAPLEQLIAEIEKCDTLCANCHREWHYLNSHSLCDSYDKWLSEA